MLGKRGWMQRQTIKLWELPNQMQGMPGREASEAEQLLWGNAWSREVSLTLRLHPVLK